MDKSQMLPKATPGGGAGAGVACPRCGANGKPVKAVTLQSLLKPEAWARAGSVSYRFCPGERCDVVYFPESGGAVFTKADLTVRVGIKETAPPRPICYCFNHTVEEIEEQVRLTGRTTVLEDIKTRLKEACWCETKNPQGSCCLGTVTRYVQAAQARYAAQANVPAEQSQLTAVQQHEDGGVPPAASKGASSGQLARAVEDCCGVRGPEAKTETIAAASAAQGVSQARTSKGEKIVWIGSIGAAAMASACCWLPLLLLAFGVSGVAASATFEKYRPWLATLTFGFLAAAFYLAYRPRPKAVSAGPGPSDACCTTPAGGEACCPPALGRRWTLQKFNRAMLWVVTVVALALVFFPNYIGAILGGGRDADFGPNLEKHVVAVEGMDCAACAAGLEQRLQRVPGVRAVQVNFEKKAAVIGFPKGNAAPKDAILAAIAESGFQGRFLDVETRTIPIAGMTCQACAARVQAELTKVPGVRRAEVIYKEKRAVVMADVSVTPAELAKAVEAAGYKAAFERDPVRDN